MIFKKKKDEEIVIKEKPTSEESQKLEEIKAVVNEENLETTSQVDTVKSESVKQQNENNADKKNGKKVVKWGPNRILQCFAYFSVILIAIAMIFRLIFKDNENPNIVEYIQGIGEVLAYIVCIWLGFYFTLKREKKIWWLVGWIIASVILVIFYIFAVA